MGEGGCRAVSEAYVHAVVYRCGPVTPVRRGTKGEAEGWWAVVDSNH